MAHPSYSREWWLRHGVEPARVYASRYSDLFGHDFERDMWLEEYSCLLTGCASHLPPCWPLLRNPVAVLTDSRRWPRHLCYHVMLQLNENGARNLVAPSVEAQLEQHRWTESFPLPVGSEAHRREAARFGESVTILPWASTSPSAPSSSR